MKKNILVIEDDKEIHIFYNEVLGKKYSLKLVTNTSDAKKLLEKNNFDLMILDIILPEKSGDVFFQEIKENKKFKDLKVLTISVLGEQEEFFKKIDKKTECLPKPINKEKLLMLVNKMTSS